MKFHMGVVAVAAALLVVNVAQAVTLFEETFEVDPTSNWTINVPAGIDPTDNSANFFFDYSTVGVPLSPNSTAGDSRGLNLQTNINNSGLPTFMGFSVSPTGQDFSDDGDYKVTFDWWANSIGPFPGGGSGSTQLSTFGVGTDGTVAQWPGGTQNSVWFSATGDGGSAADWRVYSPSQAGRFSYQEGTEVSDPPNGTFVYEAFNQFPDETIGVRSSAHPYYASFGQNTPPAEQAAIYPNQTGATVVGSAGFEWYEVEITNVGGVIKWTVNDTLIATVDTVDEGITLGGGNVFFGQSDINAGPSADENRFNLLFTLIDNIKVSTIEAVTNTPDFSGNGIVDAADYTIWRDNLGLTGTATQMMGDANGDTNVDATDYDLWKAAFGQTFPGSGGLAAVSVPEPASIMLLVCGLGACAVRRQRM